MQVKPLVMTKFGLLAAACLLAAGCSIMEGDKIDYKSAAIAATSAYAGSWIPNVYVNVVTTYALNYQMSKDAGYDVHWSNRALGANVAAAYVASGIYGDGALDTTRPGAGQTIAPGQGAQAFSWGQVAADAVQNVVRSGINYLAHRAFGDDSVHWNWGEVVTDAFGNALGNSLAGDFRYRRLNARMQDEAYAAIWADGNPFNDEVKAPAMGGVDDSISSVSASFVIDGGARWLPMQSRTSCARGSTISRTAHSATIAFTGTGARWSRMPSAMRWGIPLRVTSGTGASMRACRMRLMPRSGRMAIRSMMR